VIARAGVPPIIGIHIGRPVMLLRLFCAAAIVAASTLPAQAQLGFMLTRNGIKVTAEDMATVRASVAKVLASGKAGAVETWTASGNASGETTLGRLFESDGFPCAEIKIVVRRPERQTPYDLNICKFSDGQWLIAP
jgi:hypothetical protein